MKKHEWVGICVAIVSSFATILVARTKIASNFDNWLLVILWLFVMGSIFGVGMSNLFHRNDPIQFHTTVTDSPKEKKSK